MRVVRIVWKASNRQESRISPPSSTLSSIMCCHRLYIYAVCGHSALSEKPLIECRHAAIAPGQYFSQICEHIAHPYQSWRIESLCPPCQRQRDTLISNIEAAQVVKFDEWKWKVSYGMPAHGKDYWTKKDEQREEEKMKRRREEEQNNGRRSNRFSLKRKSTRKSTK